MKPKYSYFMLSLKAKQHSVYKMSSCFIISAIACLNNKLISYIWIRD